MTESTRAQGWYPDPWGTDHERYFDGRAWSRQTRAVGSDDPVATPGTSTAAAPTAPPPPAGGTVGTPASAGPPAAPPEVAPGWHRDPYGLAAVRWWDGSRWTDHVSGPPAGRVAVANLAGERALAGWLRPGLLLGGVAQAVALLGSADQAKFLVDHWDDLTHPGRPVPQMPTNALTSFGQLAALVGIVVAVLFLVWFHRAAATAWASGLPARRSPLLATFSFLIPVVNFWWPYQSTLDMVPATESGRDVIRWWWITWLFGTLCGLLVYPAAAVSGLTMARVVAGVGALAMFAAAFAARAVVEFVTSTHERLAATAA